MKTARKRKFQLLSAIMISILSFLILVVVPGCFNPELEGNIKIKEQTTFFMEDTSANPLPLRVGVYKTEFMGGPAYLVAYNCVNDGDIYPLGGFWGSEEEYNRAYYKWENDTTVYILLYNTATDISDEFKVFGVPSSGATGMEIFDDEEN